MLGDVILKMSLSKQGKGSYPPTHFGYVWGDLRSSILIFSSPFKVSIIPFSFPFLFPSFFFFFLSDLCVCVCLLNTVSLFPTPPNGLHMSLKGGNGYFQLQLQTSCLLCRELLSLYSSSFLAFRQDEFL